MTGLVGCDQSKPIGTFLGHFDLEDDSSLPFEPAAAFVQQEARALEGLGVMRHDPPGA